MSITVQVGNEMANLKKEIRKERGTDINAQSEKFKHTERETFRETD